MKDSKNKIKNIISYILDFICIGLIIWFVCLILLSLPNRNIEEKEKTTTSIIQEEDSSIVEETCEYNEMVDEYIYPEENVEEPKYIYEYTPVEMIYQTSAKTYMDYRAITSTGSAQYQLIHSDEITICEDGFLRDEHGFIGVAMGSYFGPIGSRYICHLEDGKEIKVIKVEAKADQHTVNGFCGYTSYDIIEFVIDTKAQWMQDNKWQNGYIFSGNFNNYEDFHGKIISIEKVEVIENNS